jgi:hypothetical protein
MRVNRRAILGVENVETEEHFLQIKHSSPTGTEQEEKCYFNMDIMMQALACFQSLVELKKPATFRGQGREIKNGFSPFPSCVSSQKDRFGPTILNWSKHI